MNNLEMILQEILSELKGINEKMDKIIGDEEHSISDIYNSLESLTGYELKHCLSDVNKTLDKIENKIQK